MNWFKKALSISTINSNTYFTTVDPLEFYEWRFTNTIPGGTKFSKTLPRSDVFTTGSLVVQAQLDDNQLNNKSVLKNDIVSNILLSIGQISTPREIIEKYQMEETQFEKQLKKFQTDALRRIFIASQQEPSQLYRLIKTSGNDEIEFENYGPLKDIMDKLRITRKSLEHDAGRKKGKAKEMDIWRRYDNIMTQLENGTLPLDTAKLEFVIKISHLSPVSNKSYSWRNFYVELYPDVRKHLDKMKVFNSKSWVKYSLSLEQKGVN